MINGITSTSAQQTLFLRTRKAIPVPQPARPAQAEEGTPGYNIGISGEAMEMLNKQQWLQNEQQRMTEQMDSARQTAEAQNEQFRNMQIAMEIAARIMRGDNVPLCDKEFLLEHSPGMFKLAMSARNHNNEDPEDHDALSRDRDESPAVRVLGEDVVNALNSVSAPASSTIVPTLPFGY